ncbi:MAG: SIS domain-containing protein [Victivallales bacterium]|nr:SIS domain-containing protein [Victivallales bacterium]
MNGAESYLSGAKDALEQVQKNLPKIKEAAKLLSDTIQAGNSIFSFGATHSFIMTEELVYRSGGLMLVNPIMPHGMNLTVRPMTMTSQLERLPDLGRIFLEHSPLKAGDALILTSTSGRNTVMIDMALAAKESGANIIALISREYSARVTSRHPSGKKLGDFADVLLDNGAPYGDAVGDIEGFPQKVGPVSTVGGCACLNAMIAETVQLLVNAGQEPPVFMSANMDGGDEFNARMLKKYSDRIHYMN